MLSGNKGEWSEIYTFLKLLGEGKLFAADENLNKMSDVFYPIIKIIREELSSNREFVINGNILIKDGLTGNELYKIPTIEFLNKAKELLRIIISATGRSFTAPTIESFLSSIDVTSLKAKSTDKSDIKLVVHDLNTGLKPVFGFSIKSLIGQNSTLFNAGKTTNFIYKVKGPKKIEPNSINNITVRPAIENRIKKLKKDSCTIEYYDIQEKNLKLNLQLIDSNLPEILGYLLLYKYSGISNDMSKLLAHLNLENPLKFDTSHNHPFYEYKIKNFLTDAALGMTPAKIWEGKYDATGGIIIVKEDGDVICYHIYNRNEFQRYLVKNTKLEQASTSRYDFGKVYFDSGNYYLKLNLQVRFN